MRKLRWILSVFVCLCCCGLWAATPYVVVSTTEGNIYRINTPNGLSNAGAAVLLYSKTGASFSLVMGPDNSSVGANPLLYVCDASDGTIIRFDPSAAVSTNNPAQAVYSGSASQNLRCGRITSSGVPVGDLVVTSSGGLLVFSGITWTPLSTTGLNLSPTSTLTTTTNGGVAQKNTGDLLAVDVAGNKIYRTPAPASGSGPAVFNAGAPLNAITGTSLSTPLGIARRSDGEIFVSNQGGTPNILHFGVNPQNKAVVGNNPACQTFSGNNKGVPAFLQMSLDDTLFVAIADGNKGIVESLDANTCSSIQKYSLSAPAIGLALPPTSTAVTLPSSGRAQFAKLLGNNAGPALFSFGFIGLEFMQISSPSSCKGTVGVNLFSPADVTAMIGQQALIGATPAVNLALDGFQAVLSTADPTLDGCGTLDGTKDILVGYFISQSNTNPQVFACDDSAFPAQCSASQGYEKVAQFGTLPLGGVLPNDGGSIATKGVRSQIFMANLTSPNDPAQQTGTFCGFQSPLTNTYSPASATGTTTYPWDAKLASSLSVGKSVPIKVKLGTGTAPDACHSAPFIGTATAILVVAQIKDSKGVDTFVPIGLVSNGSSGLLQPQFKGDGNNQYLFNWDTAGCTLPGATTPGLCPKGTYSVTVQFLTNNTVNETIYDKQTTIVVLK